MDTKDRLLSDGWSPDPCEGLIAFLDAFWLREVEGRHEFGVLPDPRHANRNGMVHGGMLMTFIDRAFGMTSRTVSGARRGATISLSHQFVAPLHIGTFATIAPRIVRLTGRMSFIEGTVMAGDAVILQAQGVWRLDRGGKTPGEP